MTAPKINGMLILLIIIVLVAIMVYTKPEAVALFAQGLKDIFGAIAQFGSDFFK